MLKLKVPALAGIPDTTPAEESVRPGGSCPVSKLHEYGCVPPEADKATEYATPTEPLLRFDGLTILTGFVNTIAKACVVDCVRLDASVTRTAKANVPAVEGTPLKTPAGLRVIPGGRLPDANDQEYGVDPPLAVNAA
jgi:hypothetical protein